MIFLNQKNKLKNIFSKPKYTLILIIVMQILKSVEMKTHYLYRNWWPLYAKYLHLIRVSEAFFDCTDLDKI